MNRRMLGLQAGDKIVAATLGAEELAELVELGVAAPLNHTVHRKGIPDAKRAQEEIQREQDNRLAAAKSAEFRKQAREQDES